MPTLHLHLDIQDQDLQKALKEALEGEIITLTREKLGSLIGVEVDRKLQGVLTGLGSIPRQIEFEIKAQIKEAVKQLLTNTLKDETWLKNEFREIVKESIYQVVDTHLRKAL